MRSPEAEGIDERIDERKTERPRWALASHLSCRAWLVRLLAVFALASAPAAGAPLRAQDETAEAQTEAQAAPAPQPDLSEQTDGSEGETSAPPASASGEASQEEPQEEPEEGVDAKVVLARIIFTTDAPANLVVGAVARGAIDPDQPLEVELEELAFTVTATSIDVIGARWSEDLILEKDEVREVAIPMLEAIEDLRKKERRELVFRDIDDGLMWSRRDNARDIAWSGAGGYCEELELGGFDNWRLPSLELLETLEAMWSLRPLKVADQFLLSACCVWSSTPGTEDGTAWNLDFRFRRSFELNRRLSFGLRALCVRDMDAEELAEARLAADPKERKRRIREKWDRAQERKRRKAAKAAKAGENG